MEFLVPNLYPNAVSSGLSTLTPTSVQQKQPSFFPCLVKSVCSEPTTSSDIGSSFVPTLVSSDGYGCGLDPDSFFVPHLNSSDGYGCAPGHFSRTVPTSFPSVTSLDPGVVMSVCSEPTTGLDIGSFFVPTLDSSDGYGCAPGHVSSTVPTYFPTFSGSVPSIFDFVVPRGDSHWATGFVSCSIQGLLSFSFQGPSPGFAMGFLSCQKLLVTK